MMSTLYTKRLNWKARIVNTNQEYKKFAFLKKIWFNVCAMRKRSEVERSNKYPWNSFLCKNFSLRSRFLQNLATNHQSGTKNGKKLVDIWKGRHVIWDQYDYLSRITWQAPKYLPNQAFENIKILSNEDFSYLYTFRKIQKVLWPMIKIDVSILTMMSDSVTWYNNSHDHYFMKKLLIYWSIILPCILFPFCALLILILSNNLEKGWQFLILLIGISLFVLYLFYSYCIYFIAKNLGEITAWFAFIPFFNFGVLLRMANMSIWWMFSLFIPLLNIFIVIKAIHNGISLRTGHGVNWTIGLLLFWVIFLPMTAIRL